MARSIMDVIQDNVNPVSVSNTLYEMMLDWRNCVVMINEGACKSKEKMRHKKALVERYLSWFMGVDGKEMRALLSQHFDIGDGEKKR